MDPFLVKYLVALWIIPKKHNLYSDGVDETPVSRNTSLIVLFAIPRVYRQITQSTYVSFWSKTDLREDCCPTNLRGWAARPWSQRIDPVTVRFARSFFAGDMPDTTTEFDGADRIRSPDSHALLRNLTRGTSIRLAKTMGTGNHSRSSHCHYVTREPRPRRVASRRTYSPRILASRPSLS